MPKRKKEKTIAKKDKVPDESILHTQHIQIEMEPITDVGAKVRIKLFFFQSLVVIAHAYCGYELLALEFQAVFCLFSGGPQSDISFSISRHMSKFGRVTVTTNWGQLSEIMTDFQSETLNRLPDRSRDRTYDLKNRSTLIIPLRHRSL